MGRSRVFPPSVVPGIPRLRTIPSGWRKVSFGDVLMVVERPVELEDNAKYELVLAKRSRGGIVSRGYLTGRDILTKQQYRVRAGDFLISRRQIVHGACGLVPRELDGAVVSGEYAALQAKEGLSLEFLSYYSHSIHFQQTCFHSSVGVDVEKMVFKLEMWMGHPFYLPPREVQDEMVRILGTWERSLGGIENLLQLKKTLRRGLLQALLPLKPTGKYNKANGWRAFELSDVASLISRKHDPRTSANEYRCIELEHIAPEEGRLIGHVSSLEQASVKTCFEPGDVLFGKLRPYLKKYYLADFTGVCSTEIWVLRPDRALCDPRYLFYLVNSHKFIGAASVTSGSKMPRADWEWVSELPILLPPLREQRRIADILSLLDGDIALLRRSQALIAQQYKGLLQALVTGEMPLPIPVT
jgi:type I restriction enzyme, S subunit